MSNHEDLRPNVLSVGYSASTSAEVLGRFNLDIDDLQGKRIIDVGSSISTLVPTLLNAGIDAYAIDPIYDTDTKAGSVDEVIKSARKTKPKKTGRTTPNKIEAEVRKKIAEQNRREVEVFVESREQHPDRYIPAFADDLPFEDDSLDLALNSFALYPYLFRNRQYGEICLREQSRVLKPGGQIYSLWPSSRGNIRSADRTSAENAEQVLENLLLEKLFTREEEPTQQPTLSLNALIHAAQHNSPVQPRKYLLLTILGRT